MGRRYFKSAKKQLRLFGKFYLHSKATDGPMKESDFAMYSEPVDIREYYKRLKGSVFEARVLEEVSYKHKKYPILRLDYNKNSRKKLLIIAGVHGNEFAAALSIIELLGSVKTNPEKYSGWHISIIAPINPVGLVHQSRYNEDGYDINRDFRYFKTAGAQAQRDVIEDMKPDVIVSLHEGPQEGFFMISEGRLPSVVKVFILKTLKNGGAKLAAKSFFRLKIQEGLWEKPRLIFWLQRVLRIYTLGSYAHAKKIPMITTETSWTEKDVPARMRPHVLVIQGIIAVE